MPHSTPNSPSESERAITEKTPCCGSILADLQAAVEEGAHE
jgi:hypothetical protein